MNRHTVERFEGDTLALAGSLKTYSTIAEGLWSNATAELLLVKASTREAVTIGGVVTLDTAPTPKRFTITAAQMPPVGSYYFRVRITFNDDTVLTFPNGERWNTLRVVKGTG